MTDTTKEAVEAAWEEYEISAKPCGSDGGIEFFSVDSMMDEAYNLYTIAKSLAADRDALRAQLVIAEADVERVARVAAALWRAETVDAGVPASVTNALTLEAFADLDPDHRARFHKFARAAIAAMQPIVSEADDIDSKMIAAGMTPLSKMLNGHGEMEKWLQHAHVHTLDDFTQWVKMKQREYMTMRMRYEIGEKDKSDDLYEWVFAHASAFDAVATQLRALSKETEDAG
jgi:hypothetical protein